MFVRQRGDDETLLMCEECDLLARWAGGRQIKWIGPFEGSREVASPSSAAEVPEALRPLFVQVEVVEYGFGPERQLLDVRQWLLGEPAIADPEYPLARPRQD